MTVGYILTHDSVIVELDIDDPEQNRLWNEWRRKEENKTIHRDRVAEYEIYTYFLDMGVAEGDKFFATAVWHDKDRAHIRAMKFYETLEEACDGHQAMYDELAKCSEQADKFVASIRSSTSPKRPNYPPIPAPTEDEPTTIAETDYPIWRWGIAVIGVVLFLWGWTELIHHLMD